MQRLTTLLALATSVCLVACGSSPTGTDSNNLVTNGTFSANINGTAWSPIGTVVVKRVTNSTLGMTAVSLTYGMTVALNGISAPGTYNVGASGLQGSQVLVTLSGKSGSWVSDNPGGTGSFTFTTFTSNHVVGTFSFDAPPFNGATGTLHVATGAFDLTY